MAVTLLFIGGFMAADKLWLNWYLPVAASTAPAAGAQAQAQATPAPVDHVVGVLRKCNAGNAYVGIRDLAGAECATSGRFNDHLEITVRTPTGQTYVVNLPSGTSVAVGDPWP